MRLKLREPAGTERVHAGVVPDVAPTSAVLAQLEVVHMSCRAIFPRKNEFMPRTVETSHSAISFIPNDQVLEFRIGGPPCRQHLDHVPPIHEMEMDRAVCAV